MAAGTVLGPARPSGVTGSGSGMGCRGGGGGRCCLIFERFGRVSLARCFVREKIDCAIYLDSSTNRPISPSMGRS